MNVTKFRVKATTLAIVLAAPALFGSNVYALSLKDATALTIKNSPQIMTEGINVKLKGADLDIAYKFFEPKLDASFTVNSLGGFEYPKEFENLSMASLNSLAPAGTFLPDEVRTEDLKLALTKIYTNGLYTQLGIDITERDSEREKILASAAINALNNGGLNKNIDDYFPMTYGVMKFVTRIPLWGRGDLAEGIGDYESKKLKYDASVANMNHAISSILASGVYAYWDNRAAAAKFQLRKESLERVERWAGRIQAVINKMENSGAARAQYAADLNRIDGFVQERRKDMNGAQTELNQSRSALANALGVPLAKAIEMGDATDDLPQAPADRSLVDPTHWNTMALANRLDIQALKLEDKAADELLKWMKDYSKPELNVILAAHQQMVDFGDKSNFGGYADALGNPSGNLGYTAGVQFAMKLGGNSAAKGRVTQATLNKMKNQIGLNNTIRKTGIDLKALGDKVTSTIATTESASQSAGSYRKSVDAAIADQTQTLGTAYRQFETERDWTNAEADHINSQATLAKVIVEVRHQTASLVQKTEDSSQIQLQDVVTLPSK